MSDYSQHALAKLNEDRLEKKLFCDFTIKTESREFPVHKCLLGVVSDYFRVMFQVEMKEKYQDYWTSNDFSCDVVSTLLDFIYGDSSSITLDNAYGVLKAAHYLQITKLLEYCVEFLSKHISNKNVFQCWELATKYCLESLEGACKKFINNNFHNLSTDSLCLNLHPAIFEEFLLLRSCNVKEEQFYETVINWIKFDEDNRESYFCELFEKIDLDGIAKSYLNSVIAESDLVLQNPAASKKLVIAMKKHLMQGNTSGESTLKEQSSDTPSTSSQSSGLLSTSQSRSTSWVKVSSLNFPLHQISNSPCKSQQHELLFVGGIDSPQYTRKFDTRSMEWSDLPCYPGIGIHGQLARFKKKFYYFGGCYSDNFNSFPCTWCLDVKNISDGWEECSDMDQKRHRFGCAFYQMKIYLAGGRAHKTEILSTAETFLPTRDEWIDCPEMDERRVGCCLVVYQKQLRVLGGQKGSVFYDSMDELGDYWWFTVEDGEMLDERADFAAVNLNGQIYAIGGKPNLNEWHSSVERFDDDGWEYVASLNSPRSGHRACVLGSKIYVAGGENGKGPVKTIEVYSAEEDTWEVIGKIRGDPVGVAMVAM